MKKFLVINSNNYANTTDFSYDFAVPITICNYFKLVYAAIPNSSYLINDSNNTLIVNFANGHTTSLKLFNQNYDIDSLATTIKNAVNYASFNMTFDANTSKYNFRATSNFSFSADSSILNVIGVEPDIVFNSTHVQAQYVVNFLNYPI